MSTDFYRRLLICTAFLISPDKVEFLPQELYGTPIFPPPISVRLIALERGAGELGKYFRDHRVGDKRRRGLNKARFPFPSLSRVIPVRLRVALGSHTVPRAQP